MLGKKNKGVSTKKLTEDLEKSERLVKDIERQRANEKTLMQAAIESEKREKEDCLNNMLAAQEELAALRENVDGIVHENDGMKEKVQDADLKCLKMQRDLEICEEEHKSLMNEFEIENKRRLKGDEEILKLKKSVATKDQLLEKGEESLKRYKTELTAAIDKAHELEIKLAQEQQAREHSTTVMKNEIVSLEDRLHEKQEMLGAFKLKSQEEAKNTLKKLKAMTDRCSQLQEELELLSMCNEGKMTKDLVERKVIELQNALYSKSESLVLQGEKILALSEKYDKDMMSAKIAKKDIQQAREMLLKELSGNTVDVSLYDHVSLIELIRILRKTDAELAHHTHAMASTITTSPTVDGNGTEEVTRLLNPLLISEGRDALGSIGKLEREMRGLKTKNKKLQTRVEELEGELQQSMAAMDDIRALKGKTAELAGRQRTEQDLRARSEQAVKYANEKVVDLTEHIEKLMLHLKHEAAAKRKSEEALRKSVKTVDALNERNDALQQKILAKHKNMGETMSKSKMLQDQLHLMDSQYKEIRSKFDRTRSSYEKQVDGYMYVG